MGDGLFNDDAVTVRADAGDEGFVIYDSTVAAFQGLFPPSNQSVITLSNGTTVQAPLGGYQYIPSETWSRFGECGKKLIFS